MTFLGVAWNGSTESMNSFIERHTLTFSSIEDPEGEVFAQFGVPYQPAWVFINEQGDPTRVQGVLNSTTLESYIAQITQVNVTQ